MSGNTAMPAVRRSALESLHGRLGRGWPMSYGDTDGERRTVTEAVGLAEPGLYDKWILRGPGALSACWKAGLEGRPGFVTPAPVGGINVWAIADDEVWLVASAPTDGGPQADPVSFDGTLGEARRVGVLATDVSSGWTVLRLFGPRFRDVLEELVARDLSPAAFEDLAIAQVSIGGCRVILSRRDTDGIPGATLLVGRDEAEYLWDVLTEIGERHGLRAVGAAVLVPGATAAGRTAEMAAAGTGAAG